jgi:hypothetical protein
MTRPTVALVMIVRDEEAVIGRCLGRLHGLIDFAVICDTGSHDRTVDFADQTLRSYREQIPRFFVHHSWKDFATNRNLALEFARERTNCDYLLMIDADEELFAPPGYGYGEGFTGAHPAYQIWTDYEGLRYPRVQLTQRKLDFYYEMPVHEELMLGDTPARYLRGITDLPMLVNVPHRDGARSGAGAQKFVGDAALLHDFLRANPLHTRAWFYYAQALRDGGGTLEDAANAYGHRAELGGWPQEVFVSLLERAKCMERLAGPTDLDLAKVMDAYLAAHTYRPSRAEAIRHLIRFCESRGQQGFTEQLKNQLPKTMTKDILFVEANCYVGIE